MECKHNSSASSCHSSSIGLITAKEQASGDDENNNNGWTWWWSNNNDDETTIIIMKKKVVGGINFGVAKMIDERTKRTVGDSSLSTSGPSSCLSSWYIMDMDTFYLDRPMAPFYWHSSCLPTCPLWRAS